MRRVVSVWFPHWPTDRLRRQLTSLLPDQQKADGPAVAMVTAVHDGRRRIVAAANSVALTLGLRSGMAMAQALAIVPGLQVMEADLGSDAVALDRLVRWCHRVTPLASADAPDGLWLDVTGCTHLWGGEAELLHFLLDRLARDGLQARAAMADTPGAAHALAHHGASMAPTIIPPGGQEAAIAPLPAVALRMPPDLVATLHRLGFEKVGHLARLPRATLARRFGPLPGLRMDQAHGHVNEPLKPLAPEYALQRRTMFLEPLLTAEALALATTQLVGPLCEEMELTGLGARQLDLLFERVDNQVAAIRIGTAQPSRDAHHLSRLLTERLDTIDPGLGVEAMHLVVTLAEPLRWEQQEGGTGAQDTARLFDRLTNRLGADQVYQADPLQSETPERTVRHAEPAPDAARGHAGLLEQVSEDQGWVEPAERHSLAEPRPYLSLVVSTRCSDDRSMVFSSEEPRHLRLVDSTENVTVTTSDLEEDPPLIAWKRPSLQRATAGLVRLEVPWPSRLHSPARLLDPPRRIEALAALPDQPPLAFTWRRRRHRVRRSDGPERINGEWWRQDRETRSIRDYFQVEDESGQRFWLFREGNGLDLRTGDLSWYLHGLF